MQVLPVIVPYIQTTSNIAISCRALWGWLSNNGFAIKSSEGDLCLENFPFYKLLDYPGIYDWIWKKIFGTIMNEDPKYLQLLLQSGADVEVKNNLGETALIYATESGKSDCLKILLEHKANIEAKNKAGNIALRLAVTGGRIDCLKLLLQNKADLEVKNSNSDGDTVLMWAAWCGKADCLKILLDHKANIEAKSIWGHTAIFRATQRGNTDCMKLLLQSGAQVSPRLKNSYPQYDYLWLDSTL